jgi:hypothetical protein
MERYSLCSWTGRYCIVKSPLSLNYSENSNQYYSKPQHVFGCLKNIILKFFWKDIKVRISTISFKRRKAR